MKIIKIQVITIHNSTAYILSNITYLIILIII